MRERVRVRVSVSVRERVCVRVCVRVSVRAHLCGCDHAVARLALDRLGERARACKQKGRGRGVRPEGVTDVVVLGGGVLPVCVCVCRPRTARRTM